MIEEIGSIYYFNNEVPSVILVYRAESYWACLKAGSATTACCTTRLDYFSVFNLIIPTCIAVLLLSEYNTHIFITCVCK